ncbi:hypothetical protein LI012_17965 [Caldibacillus thermoamylovorans]|uniref:hypothetical protein n=1 Tax=Caldibacillus thermoamylovorans TaxID=35841 RepID=UPI001D08836B|nr:hypothetical protein [Caldibacillus thermoamylovorans]MCB5936222.1 hypothetical protein [Bacillus sp. DFI.2.34]MCB7078663.1 hypothetical protein [Caldibacillus thermoamylovorans]
MARMNLVANIEALSTKNGDEIEFRRQKSEFFTPKWRRGRVSSSKLKLAQPKTVTRSSLVAKIEHF